MSDSLNQPTLDPMYPTNHVDITTRSDEAKIASYMWYIHVTVRVNAADRLRHSLAHILGQETTTTTPLSPTYSAPFGFGHINIAASRNGGSRKLVHGGDVASTADKLDDLIDYFVLDHFSQTMLAKLINTAPIEEYAEGYNRALAGIPAHFHEEFCRRLYCLLFSKYIVEWPQGIAVPEPVPGSIAAAAAAAAPGTEPEAVAGSTSSTTDVSERGRRPIQTPREEDDDENDEQKSRMDRILSGLDGLLSDDEYEDEDYFTCNNSVMDGERHKHPADPEPKSPGYQSTLGPSSPWADTPSPGYNPELAKAAYFGTVSDPLPIQYRGIWGSSSISSRIDGTARAACAEAKQSGEEGVGEYACAAAAAAAAARERASHEHERLPSASKSPRRHHQQQQHQQHQQQHAQAPPNDATPQARPASLLGSAHSRVSHTGSSCWPCRASEAWSHGVGAQQ